MKNFILLVSFCALASCKKPLANFTEAQPANTKDQSAFPSKMIGTYHNYETDTDLVIQKELILSTQYFRDTLSEKDLLKIQQEIELTSKKLNDTLFIASYNVTDTIFNLQQNDILRKLKGYYFLNIANEDKNWNVTKLKFKNNIVSLNDIRTEEEINTLAELTETVVDTIRPATFKLSKKQFRKFVKQNGFTEGSVYVKKN